METPTRWTVAAFYYFVRVDDRQALREQLLALGRDLALCGTILVAHEGINATIGGPDDGVKAMVQRLLDDPRFAQMQVKYSWADVQPFYRYKVRLKEEIVAIKRDDVDPTDKVGQYVEPSDWNQLIADPEVLVIDTRNDFEVAMGTFQGSIDPKTKSFGQFPQWAKDQGILGTKKKVAMFCTGGIRCEKATSYLLDQGVEQVYHLKGGILKYLEEVDQDDSLFEGSCFVFDRRVGVGHGLVPDDVQTCFGCRVPLTENELDHPDYEPGVCCPKCTNTLSDSQKVRFRERQLQIGLSKQRGQTHFFGRSDG